MIISSAFFVENQNFFVSFCDIVAIFFLYDIIYLFQNILFLGNVDIIRQFSAQGMFNKTKEENMAEQIKLLIAEDNGFLSTNISTFMRSQQNIEVVGVADNARSALELIKISQPNALITDLIMPESDGFLLLEKLSSGEYGKMPETIVLSALGNENLIMRSLDLGAKYYMVKPFDMDLLHKRLLDLFNMRPLTMNKTANVVKSKSLDEKITSIFLTIGIPAHIKGYQFLREAIKIVIRTPEAINSITKGLYPSIAKYFDTSPSKVERAIRHAIEVAWTRGKIGNINAIFGFNIYSKNDKPTNGEFIALIADRLLLEQSA